MDMSEYIVVSNLFDIRFFTDVAFCFLYCSILGKPFSKLFLPFLFILHIVSKFIFSSEVYLDITSFYYITGQVLILPMYFMVVIYSLYVFSNKFSSKKSAYLFIFISTLSFWFISAFIVRGPHLKYYSYTNYAPSPFIINGVFNSRTFFYAIIMNAIAYLPRYTMILLVVKIFSSRFSFFNDSSKSNVEVGQKFISNNANKGFADIDDNDTQSPITIDKLMYFDNINEIINFEPIIAIKQKDRLMYLAFKNIKAKDIFLNIDNQKIYFKPRLIVWREKNQSGVRLFKKYASLIDDECVNILKNIGKAQRATISIDNTVKAITAKDKSLLVRMLRIYLS